MGFIYLSPTGELYTMGFSCISNFFLRLVPKLASIFYPLIDEENFYLDLAIDKIFDESLEKISDSFLLNAPP